VDIRAESAFLAGHIPGAYHSSLATILDDAGTVFPTDLPIVIACYSGQTAGHAKVALELMGYEDVKTLGFGMSSWSAATRASWANNTSDLLAAPETVNNNGDLVAGAYPTLAGYDAASVVETRVAEMVAAGFKGKAYSEIQDNLDDYFILNYFGQADYEGTGTSGVPGHIPGAFQFTPYTSLDLGGMLAMLPTDMPIIVYCWTGQHSSQVTAYLNLLGYEAYSLKFGSNALFHSQLTAHVWNTGAQPDFELEMGSRMSEQLETLGSAIAEYINDSSDCPGTISAQALYDNLDDYTVIDIRAAVDYNAGHIADAYNSSLGTLLTDVGTTIPTDLPLVVACYSGQSAGHAKIALELMGYEDVKTLAFGMASWAAATRGSWDNNTGNHLASPETTNNNGDLVAYAYPTLDSYDVGTIVETRVAEMLAAGFRGVDYTAIQDNLDDYFILNYFGQADYEGTGTSGVPGHIPGAFQFTPYTSMDPETMLAYLPTDKTIVVYCWTGQHSSQITAALNMVGYDAVSLKFGSNNLFYDDLTAHKWTASAYNDFPLVATPIQ
jgi:rhodanese-related sulfurtransferase